MLTSSVQAMEKALSATSLAWQPIETDATFNLAAFTPLERVAALTFIKQGSDKLKRVALRKLKKLPAGDPTADDVHYMLDALNDPTFDLTTWDAADEMQARTTYNAITSMAFWYHYIQRPTAQRWKPIHNRVHTENTVALARRLNIIQLTHEHAQQFDTIMFLTFFLLRNHCDTMRADG
jgi:hypothetical protein